MKITQEKIRIVMIWAALPEINKNNNNNNNKVEVFIAKFLKTYLFKKD